jgi:acylpyruvate hydrolase
VPEAAASAVDWKGELAVVIGHRVRDASPDTALNAIAGYSVLNDVTMRDRQYRTTQWLQGKTFEATCPFGPVLVTPGRARRLHLVDRHPQPGDVIATGTPSGVGHALPTPRHLVPGDLLETAIDGIGRLANRVRIRS